MRQLFVFIGLVAWVNGTLAFMVERPNILWITSEDNNVNWVGCYGNEWVKTPHIDGLAAEGFRYSEVYANAPVCAPSRSTWITGMYAITMGTQPMRSRNEIPHDEIPYYPDLLRSAGYYVGNDSKTDYNIGGREDQSCWDNPKKVNWKQLQQQEPFFQVLSFYESHESRIQGELVDIEHDPMHTNLRAYHPDVPEIRKNYAKYYDAIKRMDQQVGDALAALKASGMADRTIVIYTSDHGGVLPRSKRYLYNTGLHCPLIVRIPAQYQSLWPLEAPGGVVDRLVSFVDMPKTWLSLAGVEVPSHYQGRTFLGNDQEPEATYHYAFRGRMDERFDCARAVHNKRFLLVRNYIPYAPWVQHLEYQWKIPAMRAWESHVQMGKATPIQARPFSAKAASEELYDMKADPDSVFNLINDPEYMAIAAELRSALHAWQLEVLDTGLIPESERTRMAADANLTIYEWAENAEQYPLKSLLHSADMALEQDHKNHAALQMLCRSSYLGERYWGAVGLFLIKDDSVAAPLLMDESHEVRAIAAWTLIQNGREKEGLTTLRRLIKNDSYALLKVLNILDWMGPVAQSLEDCLAKKDFQADANLKKMQQYLLHKWN